MKQLCIATTVLGVALVGAPVLGYAQQAVDIGKREYVLSCAICHGEKGKGDGPYAEQLKAPPPDLTKIQSNNSGVFPYNRLYRIIDGRQAIGVHGSREMPIWGREYSNDAAELTSGFFVPRLDRDSLVRGRIVALIGYIYTLQAK